MASLLYPQTKHPAELMDNEQSMMYNLFAKYYDACTFNSFKNDLAEKSHVLVLKEASTSKIVGFTTAMVMSHNDGQQEFKAIYSGDTIIQHNYWGSQLLLLSWCKLAGKIKTTLKDTPLYWFLIVKGHRTYRYLPLFTKRFYPTWRYPTPPNVQQVLDEVATRKFGDAYHAKKGIIHFAQSRGHLKRQWANIPPHLASKPDVNYFLKRNPNYHSGDELACITELTEQNLKSHALRAFKGELL